jgi:hypothetical protein
LLVVFFEMFFYVFRLFSCSCFIFSFIIHIFFLIFQTLI